MIQTFNLILGLWKIFRVKLIIFLGFFINFFVNLMKKYYKFA